MKDFKLCIRSLFMSLEFSLRKILKEYLYYKLVYFFLILSLVIFYDYFKIMVNFYFIFLLD